MGGIAANRKPTGGIAISQSARIGIDQVTGDGAGENGFEQSFGSGLARKIVGLRAAITRINGLQDLILLSGACGGKFIHANKKVVHAGLEHRQAAGECFLLRFQKCGKGAIDEKDSASFMGAGSVCSRNDARTHRVNFDGLIGRKKTELGRSRRGCALSRMFGGIQEQGPMGSQPGGGNSSQPSREHFAASKRFGHGAPGKH